MATTGRTVGEALRELAQRTGTVQLQSGRRAKPRRAGNEPRPRPINPFLSPMNPELDEYVTQCSDVLWRAEGEAVRQWLLETRRLSESTLRANRVGVDLGRDRQPRPQGVPAVRRAVVLPVLVTDGACFVQLRVLNPTPDFPKYLNPSEDLAPNPRLGVFQSGGPETQIRRPREVIIAEGILDALSAATAGYTAVGFLSAGYPDRVAATVLARFRGPLVIAFDGDPAGRRGARRLAELLAAQRREAGVIHLPDGDDLNSRAVASGDWSTELAARVDHATFPLRHHPPALVVGVSR